MMALTMFRPGLRVETQELEELGIWDVILQLMKFSNT